MADRLLRIADDLEAAIAGGDRRGLVGIQGGTMSFSKFPSR